ncbi:MAG: hypothetical protein M1813_005050 [Trichoglossum hirsutum]|nr:MAG: hypothetical protein M1813_005050 [Trichoglossum hirsutum]
MPSPDVLTAAPSSNPVSSSSSSSSSYSKQPYRVSSTTNFNILRSYLDVTKPAKSSAKTIAMPPPPPPPPTPQTPRTMSFPEGCRQTLSSSTDPPK